MKLKMCKRVDTLLNDFDKGMVFLHPQGRLLDLSGLLVCNIAVDTIRQLYSGTINRSVFATLKSLTVSDSPVLSASDLSSSPSSILNRLRLPCDYMKLARMGKGSGFRYKLQNNEVGIVVLLGSYFSPIEDEFSHLKIELSPHFIAKRTPAEVQAFMDQVAELFLDSPKPSGVAPHICVDLQGFTAPLDMEQHIITKSRSIRSYVGMGSLSFDGLDAVAMKYNCAETITVGKSTGLQFSIYRKDKEIIKRDTVDYYHALWGDFTGGEHDPNKPVSRVEMRFHHTVVKQFSRGIGKDINSYLALSKYLNNLWRYALKAHCFSDDGVVHPVWHFLMEDISFNDGSDIRQVDFKRSFKTPPKNDTESIKRNISMLIGNLMSIHARTLRKFSEILKDIKNSPALMLPLRAYFSQNGIDESIYFQHLEKKILERRVASKFGIAA